MLKTLAKRLLRLSPPASEHYEIITVEQATHVASGWQDPRVAQRQHDAFTPLLRQMRSGRAREDFRALTAAVKATELEEPLIIEIGCGSGWNSEVVSHLLRRPVSYVGLDYSQAMARLGRSAYPQALFVVGDAVHLPLRDACCDILVSGTSLMHVLNYREAIRESRRVTRHWCVVHTVTVVQRRATTVLRKLAYGQPSVELVFNADELEQILADAGLAVRKTFDSIPYNLEFLLGEPTVTRTYLCEVA